MLARKVIKAKILELRRVKSILLEREYCSYQRYLHGEKAIQLYSATRQQADRYLRKLRDQNGGLMKNQKEYPLILRNDVYKANTKLTPYWIRIPVAGHRGGINVPVGVSSEIPDGAKTREAKLIRKGKDWYVYITVEKEIRERQPSSVLAIDLGVHHLATTLNSADTHPRFYGKELRENQAHFYKLRKELQKKGAYGTVKKVADHERRTTDAILHKVSKKIVGEADRCNSVIVMGKLAGIRADRRGRSWNRRLSNFPFYRFHQFIKYKAEWLGIKVVQVSEAYTSQTCHNCNSKGLRVGGRFQCDSCGHEYNADYNGAYNIMMKLVKRGIGQRSISGAASLTQPVNPMG